MRKNDRKVKMVDVCLETFIKNGLSETTMRDLGKALNLNTAGIYWYFEDKDEVVIACAEEAAVRIEKSLIDSALEDVDNPEMLIENLYNRSAAMKPIMKFFVSVCALSKYEDAMRPVLLNLSERYKQYAVSFADKLGCSVEEISPYVYMTINTMSSYMLFGQDVFVAPQMELTKTVLDQLKKEKIIE